MASGLNDIKKIDEEQKRLKMDEKAENAVAAAVAAATATGVIPIPFADAPVMITEQVALMASICAIYEIDIKKDGLQMLATTALATGGATMVGKTVAANLFKLVPGVGTVGGAVISGGTGGVVTLAMGKAFIEVCKQVKDGKMSLSDLTSKKGREEMAKQFKEQLRRNKKNQDGEEKS